MKFLYEICKTGFTIIRLKYPKFLTFVFYFLKSAKNKIKIYNVWEKRIQDYYYSLVKDLG